MIEYPKDPELLCLKGDMIDEISVSVDISTMMAPEDLYLQASRNDSPSFIGHVKLTNYLVHVLDKYTQALPFFENLVRQVPENLEHFESYIEALGYANQKQQAVTAIAESPFAPEDKRELLSILDDF